VMRKRPKPQSLNPTGSGKVVIKPFYNKQACRWRLHQLLLQIMHAFNNHATTAHCSSILQFVKCLFCGTIHAHVFFTTMHMLALVTKHGCACGPHCRSLPQNYLPLCNLGTTEKTRIMSGYYWHFQDQHLNITFFTFCLRNNNLASLLHILLIQYPHLSITFFVFC
jgi:hypothetical protein